MEMENVLNDKVIIPERIKAMTQEERQMEIARLEAIAREEKKRILEKPMN